MAPENRPVATEVASLLQAELPSGFSVEGFYADDFDQSGKLLLKVLSPEGFQCVQTVTEKITKSDGGLQAVARASVETLAEFYWPEQPERTVQKPKRASLRDDLLEVARQAAVDAQHTTEGTERAGHALATKYALEALAIAPDEDEPADERPGLLLKDVAVAKLQDRDIKIVRADPFDDREGLIALAQASADAVFGGVLDELDSAHLDLGVARAALGLASDELVRIRKLFEGQDNQVAQRQVALIDGKLAEIEDKLAEEPPF